MKRILFVDDDPNVLSGLQRMLRPRRTEWEMAFAPGPEAALTALSESPFDVIVSDMRMPGMDGAMLLARVQAEHPEIVRIVLSGHTELEAAMRAVPVAHQFLCKPCDADILKAVIERAFDLRALLENETVRATVASMDKLPSVPRLYAALTKALADPESSVDDIATIVQGDVGMCAKLLHLTNSAFFGQSRAVTNVHRAVALLGTRTVKNLVLGVEMFSAFPGNADDGRFFEALQDHALRSARIAARLLPDKAQSDDAFMAAMLHDIGQLILRTRLREPFIAAVAEADRTGRPLHAIEREACGVTHAEVGAYLLGLWGLPYPILQAVAYHHAPAATGSRGFDVAAAVHVANVLQHEQDAPRTGVPPEPFDPAWLAALGVTDRLPQWRAAAEAVATAA
jgi:HD-like signal output (HDOD) protein